MEELQPPMKITFIDKKSDLYLLKDFFERKRKNKSLFVGFDTETNWTVDFWNRRVRTMQFGDKFEQFVVDILGLLDWDTDLLIDTQGNYGVNNGEHYKELLEIIEPILCNNEFLKVGQNLSFEYEVMRWNFGLRIWHLYSTDLAERVIQAGTISLKQYSEFSMVAIVKRYFGLIVDKDEQRGFDLVNRLTDKQIAYAALDSRLPIPMRDAQMKRLVKEQLLVTTQIENDAIGSYVDMHLNGQNLDDTKWVERIKALEEKRIEEIKLLDQAFLPIVGHKNSQVDEEELHRLEMIWKTQFEEATPEEKAQAALVRAEKDKEKKSELKKVLKNLELFRRIKKAEARSNFSEKNKLKTKWARNVEKCEGEAYINYDSSTQLLEALQKLPGMKALKSTSDEELLHYNDKEVIQTLRKYKKGKKSTSTYGMSWINRWVTKPCKEEGWRHPGDGRLHCVFNQLEAETGRSSSSKPNGQNLPREKEVRDCFICDPPDPITGEEFCIVTVDMSGAELRIIADLADAKTWIMAFNKGWDVHSVSTEILEREKWKAGTEEGCKYFKLGADGQPMRLKCSCKEHKKLRENTKAINFLLCYGGGPDALADELNITVNAAKELMSQHRAAFPDVWNFLERSGEQAKADKEARDMYGRRRAFPTPTPEVASRWIMEEHPEKLALPEEEQELNIEEFKAVNLRKPTKEEEFNLTHRAPNQQEIFWGIKALMGSIARRGKNHRIQGTNASIIKRAMGAGIDKEGRPYLWHTLPSLQAKLLSMVHDELIIQCPKRNGEAVKQMVGEAFKRAAAEVMHKVVMEFDGHVSNRWVKE